MSWYHNLATGKPAELDRLDDIVPPPAESLYTTYKRFRECAVEDYHYGREFVRRELERVGDTDGIAYSDDARTVDGLMFCVRWADELLYEWGRELDQLRQKVRDYDHQIDRAKARLKTRRQQEQLPTWLSDSEQDRKESPV